MSRKHCRPPTAELWCWAIYYPKWFTRFLRPSTQVKRGCWIDKQSQRGLCIPGAQQWGQLFISPSGSQLEKEMASHSSILAWKIPWTEEPGRLQSMGSQRVGHDWVTEPGSQYFFCYLFSFFLFKKIYWSIVAFRFHRWFDGEESACHAGDLFSIPGLGRSPEKRKWQLQYFLPGESHGQRTLAGYNPWGCKESDMTEWLKTNNSCFIVLY